jgi:hypothetical protein
VSPPWRDTTASRRASRSREAGAVDLTCFRNPVLREADPTLRSVALCRLGAAFARAGELPWLALQFSRRAGVRITTDHRPAPCASPQRT